VELILHLRHIPLADLFTLLAASTLLLAIAWLFSRPRQRSGQPLPGESRLRAAILYVARLACFAVLAFVFVGGAVMVVVDRRVAAAHFAPARSRVEMPAGLPFRPEQVTFTGGDDLNLAGWFVPPENGASVILLHGYGSNRTAMLWHALVLVEHGYGVLMYDERASGESQGEVRSYGWQDVEDVGGALAYLAGRPDAGSQRIGIAGCSIGGQIALRAAARYPQIEAVLADGPSAITVADLPPPHNWATALAYASNFIMDRMLEARLGAPAPPPMVKTIGSIAPRPILLIAGGTPQPFFGSESRMTGRFYARAGEAAELWVVPEAVHCDGPLRRPDEYAERMLRFFDAALK
jgi:pimeloyl-ACP methyl ester carboxylesterase